MTTALFMLRCVQIGLSIRDLDLLTIGMVNEMFIENQNDDVADKAYHRVAGQAEMDHNQGIGPKDIQAGSNTAFWWKCTRGHRWKVSPNHRIRGTGCPYCANKKVLAGFNDLETRNPELLVEWDFEKNDDVLKPCECNYLSNRKVWWKCTEGHSWKTAVSDRTRTGRGCPFCAGQRTNYRRKWRHKATGLSGGVAKKVIAGKQSPMNGLRETDVQDATGG